MNAEIPAVTGDENVNNGTVEVSVSQGVQILSMSNPRRKNALTLSMYAAMAQALEQAAQSDGIRAVLIQGKDSMFSSGNDLEDFVAGARELDESHPLFLFMRGLLACPVPVVAAVEGMAVGIGTTLLLHCDLVYASPQSSFKLPFTSLGLCPEFAVSYLLPRMAGYVKAAELLLLGEKFDAQCALDMGLINQVVEDPQAVALEKCEKLVAQAPAAVRNAKKLMRSALNENINSAFMAEAALFAEALKGPEFREAVTAFFEKRQADFNIKQ